MVMTYLNRLILRSLEIPEIARHVVYNELNASNIGITLRAFFLEVFDCPQKFVVFLFQFQLIMSKELKVKIGL